MNTIEKQAEESAAQWVKENFKLLTDPRRELTREDYIAGYMAGAVHLELKLEFARKQLRQLLVIAAEQKDAYSVSIARYALEVLK